MDITKFTSDSKDLIDRLYEETKGEVLGYEQYLKLETTEGYKNNKARLERTKKEAKLWGLEHNEQDEYKDDGVEESKIYISPK